MAAEADIGGHGWDLLWAALVLAVVAIVAYMLNRGAGRNGLLRGVDKRLSTSKTVAVAWTFVVAFMVLTVAFVALGKDAPGAYFSHVFNETPDLELYLVLLGGPYAAAVLANALVGNYVASGQVQRTDAERATLGDLVSNESGATDPYDFQYVLFNLIAMVAVLVIFIDRPGAGAPEIPTFLAVLTGGSAATYATRKALAKNPPVITSMVPTTAKVGDEILVRGENLFLSTPPPPPPPPGVVPDPPDETRVTVGGVAATVVKAQADRVTFIVPAVATGQHEVRLTTNLGATAEKVEQLTVVS